MATGRPRLHARPDLHSRIVAAAKIGLPLVALAILSSLFLFARVVDPDAAIPYADVDIADYARDPRLTAPTYAGTTRDGDALTLRAAEARPADGGGATAQGVALELTAPGGATTTAAAGHAALQGDRLVLSGGVRITSPTGFVVQTDALTALLDSTRLASTGPVTATGPVGELSAGALQLQARDGAQVLDFTGGVRVLYRPGN